MRHSQTKRFVAKMVDKRTGHHVSSYTGQWTLLFESCRVCVYYMQSYIHIEPTIGCRSQEVLLPLPKVLEWKCSGLQT